MPITTPITANPSLTPLNPPGATFPLRTSPRTPTPAQRWHSDQTTRDHPTQKRREAITRTILHRSSITPTPTHTLRSTRQHSLSPPRSNHPTLQPTTRGMDRATCNNSRWTTYTRMVIHRTTTTEALTWQTMRGMASLKQRRHEQDGVWRSFWALVVSSMRKVVTRTLIFLTNIAYSNHGSSQCSINVLHAHSSSVLQRPRYF